MLSIVADPRIFDPETRTVPTVPWPPGWKGQKHGHTLPRNTVLGVNWYASADPRRQVIAVIVLLLAAVAVHADENHASRQVCKAGNDLRQRRGAHRDRSS